MKRLIIILFLSSCSLYAQTHQHSNHDESKQESHDLLRFVNSDTLHGTFHGFSDARTIKWKSPEAAKPILFSTEKIHRVVLRDGLAKLSPQAQSTATLVNGDIVHGKVTAANADTIHIKSPYLGAVELPRDKVSSLSLKPHGGKLHYYGPLNTQGWRTIPTKAAEESGDEDKNPASATAANSSEMPYRGWRCISNAWWSGPEKDHCLVMENALPEKCTLSFELAWQGSLYAQIGLFADLAPPDCNRTKNLKSYMATSIGKAYTIYINSHSVSLYTYSFDDNGEPDKSRVEGSVSVNLRNVESTHMEFRVDRSKKHLLFYLDGEFKMKWPLDDLADNKGNALAFFTPAYTHTPCKIRIRDITITHWNGLEDSARSAHNSELDIILLSNGLDRFSGTFQSLQDDTVIFDGQYGNQLKIPRDKIIEINFASKDLVVTPNTQPGSTVHFYNLPHGRLSGTPVSSTEAHCMISSEILGTIRVDTDYVNIIDFSQQNNLLDFWDDHF